MLVPRYRLNGCLFILKVLVDTSGPTNDCSFGVTGEILVMCVHCEVVGTMVLCLSLFLGSPVSFLERKVAYTVPQA